MQHLLVGLIAGAAGTTAINLVTYLDMTFRGRPSSTLPAEVAGSVAQKVGLPLEEFGQRDKAENRKEGLGAILGIANGVLLGGAFGLLHPVLKGLPIGMTSLLLGGLAMAASDLPATSLGKTDPSTWPPSSWAADIAPHFVYGLVTAWTTDRILAASRASERRVERR